VDMPGASTPVLSGTVPPLDGGFVARPETGMSLASGLSPGLTTVLTDGPEIAAGHERGVGGTGKTQLAVALARTLWETRAVDVLVWVNASSRESIITAYARTVSKVSATVPGENADTAAERFLTWLAKTRRPWAVVLDDLTDPDDLNELWPHGSAGQVLVTTRLDQGVLRRDERRIVQVGGFTRREAVGYFSARLNDYPDQRIEALDLAEDLDCLPLTVGQAAALIADRGQTCAEYRIEFAERAKHMANVTSDGFPPAVLATWSLAVEHAHQLSPANLAWPALVLLSMLDPNGVPESAITNVAACAYIVGRPSMADEADQNLIRGTLSNLARLGLVAVDPVSTSRWVRTHAAVQAAARRYLPPADLDAAVSAAANALLFAWPDEGDVLPLGEALRDCTAALRAVGGDLLRKRDGQALLLRAGISLEKAGLAESAIAYWTSILAGSGQALAVQARDHLASAYEAAGRVADSITMFSGALTERERDLGSDHPDTITARASLAHAYSSAGLHAEAVAAYQRAIVSSERTLGPAHPDTIAARGRLVAAHQAEGEHDEAVSVVRQTLADAEQMLGVIHPETLAARSLLGAAYGAAGRHKDAIGAYERVLSERVRIYGPDHPDAVNARGDLAAAFRSAGRLKEAVPHYERVVTDRERLLGPDHPDTVTARANLAFAFRSAGRLKNALPLYERVLADRERLQGSDHRETIATRGNLAGVYQLARRIADAIPAYERALADSERMLGPGDIETLTTRCNLATAYYTAGRLTDVISVLRRALDDCTRYLGPDDPMTETVRENLDAATRALSVAHDRDGGRRCTGPRRDISGSPARRRGHDAARTHRWRAHAVRRLDPGGSRNNQAEPEPPEAMVRGVSAGRVRAGPERGPG
jgi:tetratricopeptide (TPR) repeat protein